MIRHDTNGEDGNVGALRIAFAWEHAA